MTVDRRQVNRFLAASGLPASLCATLDKLAAKDPALALEQAEHEQAKRARGSQAPAPRARRPVVEIVAGAVAEGRIAASSAPYWSERMTSAPRETETLLTASVEDGGLYALGQAPEAPMLTAAQEQAAHEHAFAAQFPRQAAALGYEPRRASPFTVQARTPVHRPGRTPVQHIRDAS